MSLGDLAPAEFKKQMGTTHGWLGESLTGPVRAAPRSAHCSATGVQASSSWTGHGRIAPANDRARDLLRLGDRFSDRDGALCIPSSAENTTLQQLLGRALPRYGDRGVSGSIVMTRPNSAPEGERNLVGN